MDPLFPPDPVYLLNTGPRARNAAFLFSYTSSYIGSNPALTSDDNIFEFASVLLSTISLYSTPSFKRTYSATAFSKNRDVIPLAPVLPISSLSTSRQQEVLATSSALNIANRDVNAHTLSSCPYARIMLLSRPQSLAFPAGTISSSAERKSSSSTSYLSFRRFLIFLVTAFSSLSSGRLPIRRSICSPSIKSFASFSLCLAPRCGRRSLITSTGSVSFSPTQTSTFSPFFFTITP